MKLSSTWGMQKHLKRYVKLKYILWEVTSGSMRIKMVEYHWYNTWTNLNSNKPHWTTGCSWIHSKYWANLLNGTSKSCGFLQFSHGSHIRTFILFYHAYSKTLASVQCGCKQMSVLMLTKQEWLEQQLCHSKVQAANRKLFTWNNNITPEITTHSCRRLWFLVWFNIFPIGLLRKIWIQHDLLLYAK